MLHCSLHCNILMGSMEYMVHTTVHGKKRREKETEDEEEKKRGGVPPSGPQPVCLSSPGPSSDTETPLVLHTCRSSGMRSHVAEENC